MANGMKVVWYRYARASSASHQSLLSATLVHIVRCQCSYFVFTQIALHVLK